MAGARGLGGQPSPTRMSAPRGLAAFSVLLALLLGLASTPAAGASRVLPGLRFRVLHTPHFRVYYHQSGEARARRLAGIAESVHATLPARLGLAAPAITHVLLVDQDDTANGWATPLPYNTVMLTAAWPAPSEIIGNTNDWLRLVFVHEYTHVLHLHQSRGWARAARFVFGRAPFAFPNLFLPQWEVEGLATFAETRETGQGRLAAGDSLSLVSHRVRQAGREPLDRLNGGQVAWPGGTGAYLYGGFFADYLAARFGEQKLGELARRSAGRLPYFGAGAFRATFGEGLKDLWQEFQQEVASRDEGRPACGTPASPDADGDASGPAPRVSSCRQLTRHGHYVSTPRFAAGTGHLVYGISTPDDFPSLMLLPLGGPGGGASRTSLSAASVGHGGRSTPRRLVTRYGGEQVSVSGQVVYYDQADYSANVAWRSDLYAADLRTGREQRLTREGRLLAPDVSPDGRTLAAIRLALGSRRLVLFRVEGSRVGALTISELSSAVPSDEAVYGSPRWSPDGRHLAVERRLPGGPSEIVLLDAAGGTPRVVVSSARGRNLTPAWMPDGEALLFASDREGGAFAIYALRLGTGEVRRVLAVAGGALSPEVSPDGQRLVFVGYTAAGYDIFAVPLKPLLAESVAAPTPGAGADASDSRVPRADGDLLAPAPGATPPEAVPASDEAYHPLATLLPRAWMPAADSANGGVRAGLSTGGTDVLGRHAFGVTTLWRLNAGSEAMFGPRRARPDWSAFYTYDRWRPTVFAAAAEETSFLRQSVRGVRVADAELRETSLTAGVSLPFLRLRRSHLWHAAFNLERDRLLSARGAETFHRNAIRTAWAFNNAHVFGLSVSPEQGVSLGVTSEQVRSVLGADGDADAFTVELRGYARLAGRHGVLAARAAAGVARGDAGVARVFYLGGAQPAGALIDFGSGALSMLRGFADKEFAGSRTAVANVEYRHPLWRIERGRGTWPLLVRTVHAAVFVDAGQVWERGFAWRDTLVSLGAELSLDTVVGFGLPLTVSAGVARPWHAGRARDLAAYLRLGRSF